MKPQHLLLALALPFLIACGTDDNNSSGSSSGSFAANIVFEKQRFATYENSPAGTVVGTLSGTVSPERAFTFDTNSPSFDVAPSGLITVSQQANLDHEAKSVHEFYAFLRVDGGDYATQRIFVDILNAGEGTENDPYQIRTLEELQSIATGFRSTSPAPITTSVDISVRAHYVLANDIDASPTDSVNWKPGYLNDGDPLNDTYGFLPIGTEETPFRGHFNGNGYTIRGLTIQRPNADHVGLFGVAHVSSSQNGQVADEAMLINVRLEDVAIVGRDRVGSLVGTHTSDNPSSPWRDIPPDRIILLRNNFSSGSVSGRSYVGGLIGNMLSVDMELSGSSGTVRGDLQVGGLVGLNRDGFIRKVYSVANVSGRQAIGGLIGRHAFFGISAHDANYLDASFASGQVFGSGRVGGLIGENNAIVKNSFASGQAFGKTCTGGLIGLGDGRGVSISGIRATRIEYSFTLGDVYSLGDESETIVEPIDASLRNLTSEVRCPYTDSADAGTVYALVGHSYHTSFDNTFSIEDIRSADPEAELPVLNRVVGNVLDSAGQQDLIAFALEDRQASATAGTETTLEAPAIVLQNEANTLEYYWGLPPGYVISGAADTAGTDAASIVITPTEAGTVGLQLTILERNLQGGIVRVYSDGIILNVD